MSRDAKEGEGPSILSLRERAERKAREAGANAETLSPEEAGKVLHELSVHQVELQMQNDELRRTQEELESSRERYVDLYDLAPVGYCTISEEGLILEANLTLATLLGTTRTLVVRKMFSAFVFKEDQDAYYRRRRQCFDAGLPQTFELRMKRDDGFFWARLDANPSRQADGEPVCRVALSDVTEHRKAEEELARYREGLEELVKERTAAFTTEVAERRKAEKALRKARDELEARVRERTAALRESEERALVQKREIDAYYDASPTGLAVFDRDLRYLRVNRTLAALHGLSPEAHSGKTARDVLSPRLADHVEPLLRRVVETGEEIAGVEYAGVAPGRPGVRGAWMETFSPLFDGSGNVRGVASAVQDVTELRALEAQLRQAQKMEALGTLAGGIAHDFNNILAAMIGFAELMKDRMPEGSRQREHAGKIVAAGVRGRDLVRQMLTFSRQVEHPKKPLRLGSIVKESAKLLRSSTPSTIDMKVRVKDDKSLIMGDPVQIEQVLMNLATNAIHAMRDGGVLEIGLSRADAAPSADLEPGPYARLTVRDTGAGMTPEIVDRIFDPFFTTKGLGEGTGLGLSVVLGIVKQSRGHIAVESAPGKGTTFDVYFPAIADEPAKADLPGDLSVPGGHERLLFVDDEPALTEMAEEILTGLGYEVAVETSPRAALARFRLDPSRFDLVVTDQTMPETTGIRLAEELLAVRPDVPVILCTGFSQTATEKSAKEAGIRAFVMKPLTKGELARTVRKVLDGEAPSQPSGNQ